MITDCLSENMCSKHSRH